ncbi:MAG TPA: DUF484 family protein [Thermohalobaculum sp.]|nr:DUF484 family protein [Thermohalobaculum sp.]
MNGDLGTAAPGSAFEIDAEERDLIRSLILAEPELVLGDDQVMRRLIGASDTGAADGRRIVDLRDRLVERLETRLTRLVHTNRSVIAAAYETVAGTGQLHRAVLDLIGAPDLGACLRVLTLETPLLVGVEEARLCLEAHVDQVRPADELGPGLEGRVLAVPEGTAEAYLALAGEVSPGGVVLRPAGEEAELLFGYPNRIRSEACLRLDMGGSAGLMVFGAADPDRFGSDQGTDLLAFFAGVVERVLLRHLQAAGRIEA